MIPDRASTAAGRALEQRLAYDRDPAHYEPGDFFIDDRRDIIAIEAEARAEPPRIVTLAWDATAEDVARIRRDWEAAAEPRAEGLDVERVGRIFHDRLDQSVLGHAGPVCQPCRQNAKAFAREYAALEEPTE